MGRNNKSPKVSFTLTDLTTMLRNVVRGNGKTPKTGTGTFQYTTNYGEYVEMEGGTMTPLPTTTTTTTEEPTTTTTTTEEPTTTTSTTEEPTTTTTIDYTVIPYQIITSRNVQSFPGSLLPEHYVFGQKDSNGDFIYSDYDVKCIVESIPNGGYGSWTIGVENNSDEYLSVGDNDLVRFSANTNNVIEPFNHSTRGYYIDTETRFGNTIDKYIINIVNGEVISIVSFDSIGDVSGCNLPTETTTTTTVAPTTTTTTTEPPYSITSNYSSISVGEGVTYTVSATGVADNTTVDIIIDEGYNMITGNQIITTNQVTIMNETATFTHSLTSFAFLSLPKTFTAELSSTDSNGNNTGSPSVDVTVVQTTSISQMETFNGTSLVNINGFGASDYQDEWCDIALNGSGGTYSITNHALRTTGDSSIDLGDVLYNNTGTQRLSNYTGIQYVGTNIFDLTDYNYFETNSDGEVITITALSVCPTTTTTTTVTPTITTTTTDDGLYEYFMSEPVLTEAELCNQSFNLRVKHSIASANNWVGDFIKNMDGSTYYLPNSGNYFVVVARADLSPSLYNQPVSSANTTPVSPGVYISQVRIANYQTYGAKGIQAYGWYGSNCPAPTTTTTTTVAPTTTTTTESLNLMSNVAQFNFNNSDIKDDFANNNNTNIGLFNIFTEQTNGVLNTSLLQDLMDAAYDDYNNENYTQNPPLRIDGVGGGGVGYYGQGISDPVIGDQLYDYNGNTISGAGARYVSRISSTLFTDMVQDFADKQLNGGTFRFIGWDSSGIVRDIQDITIPSPTTTTTTMGPTVFNWVVSTDVNSNNRISYVEENLDNDPYNVWSNSPTLTQLSSQGLVFNYFPVEAGQSYYLRLENNNPNGFFRVHHILGKNSSGNVYLTDYNGPAPAPLTIHSLTSVWNASTDSTRPDVSFENTQNESVNQCAYDSDGLVKIYNKVDTNNGTTSTVCDADGYLWMTQPGNISENYVKIDVPSNANTGEEFTIGWNTLQYYEDPDNTVNGAWTPTDVRDFFPTQSLGSIQFRVIPTTPIM